MAVRMSTADRRMRQSSVDKSAADRGTRQPITEDRQTRQSESELLSTLTKSQAIHQEATADKCICAVCHSFYIGHVYDLYTGTNTMKETMPSVKLGHILKLDKQFTNNWWRSQCGENTTSISWSRPKSRLSTTPWTTGWSISECIFFMPASGERCAHAVFLVPWSRKFCRSQGLVYATGVITATDDSHSIRWTSAESENSSIWPLCQSLIHSQKW